MQLRGACVRTGSAITQVAHRVAKRSFLKLALWDNNTRAAGHRFARNDCTAVPRTNSDTGVAGALIRSTLCARACMHPRRRAHNAHGVAVVCVTPQ